MVIDIIWHTSQVSLRHKNNKSDEHVWAYQLSKIIDKNKSNISKSNINLNKSNWHILAYCLGKNNRWKTYKMNLNILAYQLSNRINIKPIQLSDIFWHTSQIKDRHKPNEAISHILEYWLGNKIDINR